MPTLYTLSPSQVLPSRVHLDREELAAIAAEYDREEDLEIFAELSPESEDDEADLTPEDCAAIRADHKFELNRRYEF